MNLDQQAARSHRQILTIARVREAKTSASLSGHTSENSRSTLD
jgi:hypothetical protein